MFEILIPRSRISGPKDMYNYKTKIFVLSNFSRRANHPTMNESA